MYISKKEINEKNLNKFISYIKNKLFIRKELKTTNELLNNVNGYPLDINQRKAVITDEDAILLIAGAGSGKTLTIVGKIRYLIEVLGIKKDDILCISFTNASVESLKNALLKNYNYNIDVCTFHKLSFDILKCSNKNISICDDDLLLNVIDEFFYNNLINKELLNIEGYNKIKDLIITFINLYKSNNYDINYFDKIFKNLKYSNEYILLRIIKYIYKEYMNELNASCEVDFNDMINCAINVVKNNGYIKKYKYIIIDEYQDTSFTKYKLISEIKNRLNCKLFVVGDDFQSIYRFTGCNLNIFLRFKEYFKYSKIMKINNTYRNSKELINVSGSFIMKNKSQIRKRLKSNKSINKPIIIVYTNNKLKALKSIINNIDTKILILGRNNNDLYKITKDNILNERINYLTVHKSKGLEEDNVILINLDNSIIGFPSKIENDNIMKYVLNDKDIFPYEEERRLFYVALTRTKNYIYLIVNKNSESVFIKEIKNNKNVKIMNI